MFFRGRELRSLQRQLHRLQEEIGELKKQARCGHPHTEFRKSKPNPQSIAMYGRYVEVCKHCDYVVRELTEYDWWEWQHRQAEHFLKSLGGKNNE